MQYLNATFFFSREHPKHVIYVEKENLVMLKNEKVKPNNANSFRGNIDSRKST